MAPRRQRSPPPVIDPRVIPRPVEAGLDQADPPVIHPGDEGLHPFLRFPREDDRSDRDRLLARAASHGFDSMRYIVWDSLHTLQLQARAETTCGPHWRRFFSIAESACFELAIEFFSTIHLVTPLVDYEREDALTFRLGGVERRLSLQQFAVFMGLYTEEELGTPAFLEGITDWPEGMTPHAFWMTVGTGPYTAPSLPKSTRLRDPLHRLIHRAIVHSLSSRSESPGSVTQPDLFYLYCIVSGTPCQLAERLARFLFSMRQARVNQAIYGGGFVYRLARAMDILPLAELEALTISSVALPIDLPMMTRMRLIRKEGRRYILLDGEGRPWVPHRDDIAEAPVVMDQGASGSGTQAQTEAHPDLEPEPELPTETYIPAPQPSPHRHSPPRQTEPPLVYQRSYSGSIRRLASEMAELRRSQDEIRRSHVDLTRVQSDILELQGLEYTHAEAHRQYTSRMLLLIGRGQTDSFPEPPEPPARLRHLYARIHASSTYHQHQQPPQ